MNGGVDAFLNIEGAVAAALVDSNSGTILASAGDQAFLRVELNTMKSMRPTDTMEDILVTLGKQYHIIRPVGRKSGRFVYLVLDKSRANLAQARAQTGEIVQAMPV